jgi:mannose-1-phosphate guanylyltransferase
MEICIVVMAGGRGERFWPLSRHSRPKQFLPIVRDDLTMVEETLRRAYQIARQENVFLSLRADLIPAARALLPDFPVENLIVEPLPRDTAAAMGLASVQVERMRPGSVMAVLPSDHLVSPDEAFMNDIRAASKIAYEMDCLMTLAIKPIRPDTAYGYIHVGELIRNKSGIQAFEVKEFLEKPDQARATDLFKKPDYFWNAGIFIWKPSVLLSEMERHLPGHHANLMQVAELIGDVAFLEKAAPFFERMEKISIDYGVMEKADNVLCMKATFEWDDIGNWTALQRLKGVDPDGNVLTGKSVVMGSAGCEVLNYSKQKLVAVMGMRDAIVVNTDDAILICDKGSEQEIKKLVKRLESMEGMRDFTE